MLDTNGLLLTVPGQVKKKNMPILQQKLQTTPVRQSEKKHLISLASVSVTAARPRQLLLTL